MTSATNEARIVMPAELIGAATACEILQINRSTLVRRIASGNLVPLAQLDGPRGVYIFLRPDVQAVSKN